MGGGSGGNTFQPKPFPRWVWSPTGGWWANPRKWPRNTAIAVVAIAGLSHMLWKSWTVDNPEDWELKIESVQSDRARAYMRWIRRQSPELQAEIQEAMKQNEEDRERFEKGDYVSAELAGQKISTLFASMGLKTINFIENPFDDRIEQRFRRRFER